MSENVIYSINGPVVKVKNAKDFSMLEMACKGRSIPSKIFLKIPGPNVTQIGDPVEITGSPGFKPVVVSYTWIVVKRWRHLCNMSRNRFN